MHFANRIIQILVPNIKLNNISVQDLYKTNQINKYTYEIVQKSIQVRKISFLSEQEIFAIVERYKSEITALLQQRKTPQLPPQMKFENWLMREKVLFIDNYKILKMLGKGGFGKVYLAEDSNLGTKVAIKILLEDREVIRFQREMQIYKNLSHQHIVDIYNSGTYKNSPYIVMEYIEGALFDAWWKKQQDVNAIVKCLSKIANALHYAHENGVIHRDIKPSNIIICSSGEPKILDFGIGKLQGEQDYTESGKFLGTPMYVAPEILCGEKADNRADIYSLGIVLYKILTNKNPFEADNNFALMHQIINIDPVLPSKHVSQLPLDLEVVCLKAIAKKRNKRYTTAFEFSNNLKKAVGLESANSYKKTYYNTVVLNSLPKINTKIKYIYLIFTGILTALLATIILYLNSASDLEFYQVEISYNDKKIQNAKTILATGNIEFKSSKNSYLYAIFKQKNQWQFPGKYIGKYNASVNVDQFSNSDVLVIATNRKIYLEDLKLFRMEEERGFKKKNQKPHVRIYQIIESKKVIFYHNFYIDKNIPFDLEIMVKAHNENSYQKLSNLTVVREKDEVRLHIKSNDPEQHLAIFLHDAKKNTFLLFPEFEGKYTHEFLHYAQGNFLKLPQDDESYVFDGDTGEENIICFYQKQPIDLKKVMFYLKRNYRKHKERGMKKKNKPFLNEPIEFVIKHQ